MLFFYWLLWFRRWRRLLMAAVLCQSRLGRGGLPWCAVRRCTVRRSAFCRSALPWNAVRRSIFRRNATGRSVIRSYILSWGILPRRILGRQDSHGQVCSRPVRLRMALPRIVRPCQVRLRMALLRKVFSRRALPRFALRRSPGARISFPCVISPSRRPPANAIPRRNRNGRPIISLLARVMRAARSAGMAAADRQGRLYSADDAGIFMHSRIFPAGRSKGRRSHGMRRSNRRLRSARIQRPRSRGTRRWQPRRTGRLRPRRARRPRSARTLRSGVRRLAG